MLEGCSTFLLCQLSGSNDIANLYPEKATLPAGAHGNDVRDKLKNKLTTSSAMGR